MSRLVIIRCDYFSGSGVGHLKRCDVLARALVKHSLEAIFALDDRGIDLPFQLSGPIVLIQTFLDEYTDASNVVSVARSLGACLVIVDSYRITSSWIAVVSEAGLPVAAIDDLGKIVNADLRIDYSASATSRSSYKAELLGPRFFITDSSRLYGRPGPPKSMILHAGGNGEFWRCAPVYKVASEVARRKGLRLTWLCANLESSAWLETSGNITVGDKVIGWQKQSINLWSEFDVVVGPASTSLYEAILQGALPISFPISHTQTSDRDGWLTLGHLLHLTANEVTDLDLIDQLISVALQEYELFLGILSKHSAILDHRGVNRVASCIDDLVSGRPLEDLGLSSGVLGIRECQISDAQAFLNARNAERVKALSTHKGHTISWAEHILWWCKHSTTERFVLEGISGPEVFFWHRACQFEEYSYLIGGWFPAGAGPSFAAAIRLLDWQLTYCAKKYPDHLWIATIRRENRSVIMLNRRYGFVDAGPRAQAAAARLFPGTNDDFVVLERKSDF